jgi:hypothetical protein
MSTVDEKLVEWVENLDGDCVLAIEAQKFLDTLTPKERNAWLNANAETLVTGRMQMYVGSKRRSAVARRPRETFAELAENHEPEEMPSLLETRWTVDSNHTKKPLGDMIESDCLFVADRADRRAEAERFTSAFMRAIAKKLNGRAVRDVYTNDQLYAMRPPRELTE